MKAAEVIVFEGADPREFSRVDAIARERALEGLSDYLSRVVALALGARTVRRFGCPVFKARK